MYKDIYEGIHSVTSANLENPDPHMPSACVSVCVCVCAHMCILACLLNCLFEQANRIFRETFTYRTDKSAFLNSMVQWSVFLHQFNAPYRLWSSNTKLPKDDEISTKLIDKEAVSENPKTFLKHQGP